MIGNPRYWSRTARSVGLGLVAAAALAALVVAATASSATPSKAATRTQSSPTTVSIWDVETEPGRMKAYASLIADFSRSHPNIHIARTAKGYNNLIPTLKLVLSGSHPPDIAQNNQGYALLAPLAQAKLVVPLNAYAKRWGWASRQAKSLQQMDSLSADGKYFGGSTIYGVSSTADLTGVFFNRAKLRQLGLTVPKTFAEFKADLAAAKSAKQTPIMFGNQDKWPVIHEFQMLWEIMSPKPYLFKYIFGHAGASFDTPGAVQAATELQSWAKNGYFEDGFNGVTQDSAWQRFAKGDGVFLLGGTWLAADIGGAMKGNVGFFVVPPVKQGGPAVTIGSGSNPFSISSKSKHQAEAAVWLDYLTSRRAAVILAKSGNIPAYSALPAGSVPKGTVQADILNAFRAVSRDNGIIPYMDFSTPTATDVISTAGGELLGLQSTPSQFVATIEKDYAQFQKTLG